MISTAVVRCYGLRMRPCTATYTVANGTPAKLTGEVDLILQVHTELALHLEDVKVQDMGEQYLFLVGADVLRGASGLVDRVEVVTGRHLKWERKA